MKRIIAVAFAGIALAWLALFMTSHGVLVRSLQHRPVNAEQDVLTCTYFTGMSVVEREFWYAPNNLFGRAICPRLYDFSS